MVARCEKTKRFPGSSQYLFWTFWKPSQRNIERGEFAGAERRPRYPQGGTGRHDALVKAVREHAGTRDVYVETETWEARDDGYLRDRRKGRASCDDWKAKGGLMYVVPKWT